MFLPQLLCYVKYKLCYVKYKHDILGKNTIPRLPSGFSRKFKTDWKLTFALQVIRQWLIEYHILF